MYDSLFIIISGVLATGLLLMRTNVAFSILGLTAGYVFNDFFSERLAGYLYSNQLNGSGLPVYSLVAIILTILPSAVIAYRFRHYQKDRAIFHFIPIFGYVSLATVLILHNLPLEYQQSLIEESVLIDVVNRYELSIIAIVIILAIVDVMIFELQRDRKLQKLKKRQSKRHKD